MEWNWWTAAPAPQTTHFSISLLCCAKKLKRNVVFAALAAAFLSFHNWFHLLSTNSINYSIQSTHKLLPHQPQHTPFLHSAHSKEQNEKKWKCCWWLAAYPTGLLNFHKFKLIQPVRIAYCYNNLFIPPINFMNEINWRNKKDKFISLFGWVDWLNEWSWPAASIKKLKFFKLRHKRL